MPNQIRTWPERTDVRGVDTAVSRPMPTGCRVVTAMRAIAAGMRGPERHAFGTSACSLTAYPIAALRIVVLWSSACVTQTRTSPLECGWSNTSPLPVSGVTPAVGDASVSRIPLADSSQTCVPTQPNAGMSSSVTSGEADFGAAFGWI
jgi:hypothetical protein